MQQHVYETLAKVEAGGEGRKMVCTFWKKILKDCLVSRLMANDSSSATNKRHWDMVCRMPRVMSTIIRMARFLGCCLRRVCKEP